MRVAFDLDNTLIRNDFEFPVENPEKYFLSRLTYYEKLREGTKEIFDFCKQNKWETWIYTTSYRQPLYIRKVFWLYSIYLDGVINQDIHFKKVQLNCSKYPPCFGIHVIIDDSEGVKIESEIHHFNAIWLKPTNHDWVKDLKIALLAIFKSQN